MKDQFELMPIRRDPLDSMSDYFKSKTTEELERKLAKLRDAQDRVGDHTYSYREHLDDCVFFLLKELVERKTND